MKVCTIASGSTGNSMVISCGETHILIDAGISARRITLALGELGIHADDLSGILVTHHHTDHMAGIGTLTKKRAIPIYATAPTAAVLCQRLPATLPLHRLVEAGQSFVLGGLEVFPFPTPHDAEGSVGYRVCGDGATVALATDLGHITQAVLDGVLGADLLVAETNHDVDWVQTSPYPYPIRQRILGDYGHLSNETGAELICRAVRGGTKAVLLAHLSAENNTPIHALRITQEYLRRGDIDPHRDIYLRVAPKNGLGPQLILEDGRVTVVEEVAAC